MLKIAAFLGLALRLCLCQLKDLSNIILLNAFRVDKIANSVFTISPII